MFEYITSLFSFYLSFIYEYIYILVYSNYFQRTSYYAGTIMETRKTIVIINLTTFLYTYICSYNMGTTDTYLCISSRAITTGPVQMYQSKALVSTLHLLCNSFYCYSNNTSRLNATSTT